MTSMPEGPALETLLLCTVADRGVAIPLDDVASVLPMLALTALPGAPAGVVGLANLQGTPVPIYRLRALFDAPPVEDDVGHHIVLCDQGGRRAGLVVDRAQDLATPSLLRVPEEEDGIACSELLSHVARVDDRLFLVLDAAAVIAWLARVAEPATPELS